MTKKELIELLQSDMLKMIPDDAQVLFRTNKKLRLCQRLQLEQISADVDYEPNPYHGLLIGQDVPPESQTTAIVIDALPTDWMKHQLHVTFDLQADGQKAAKLNS